MNASKVIQKIYETSSVVGRNGEVHELHSAIDQEEGQFLFNIIRNDPSISKTLEVGCAYGLSSLHICSASQDREGASHTIIDPFQHTDWKGVGVKNLKEAGIDFFNLIELKSEFALPQVLEEKEGTFDFVFIDGWHTFDHTLADCFFATKLLRVGGYLAIDDVYFPSVRRVVDLFDTYPCYEHYGSVNYALSKSWKKALARRLLSPFSQRTLTRFLSMELYKRIFEDTSMRMVALKKVSEDKRNWDWHDDMF